VLLAQSSKFKLIKLFPFFEVYQVTFFQITPTVSNNKSEARNSFLQATAFSTLNAFLFLFTLLLSEGQQSFLRLRSDIHSKEYWGRTGETGNIGLEVDKKYIYMNCNNFLRQKLQL
jgi:hypothetical protein